MFKRLFVRLFVSLFSSRPAPTQQALNASTALIGQTTDDERRVAAEEALASLQTILSRGDELPVSRMLSSGEPCFCDETTVWLPKQRDDHDIGYVDITRAGLFFNGDKKITCPWLKVVSIERDRRSVVVHMSSRSNAVELEYDSRPAVAMAHLIALTVWKQSVATAVVVPTPQKTQQAQPRRKAPRVKGMRRQDLPIEDATHVDLGTAIGYSMGIVGESYRQTALRALSGGARQRGEDVYFTAVLVLEPSNAYDPSAVRVEVQHGAHVGYLSREDAEAYQRVLKALSANNKIGACRAKLIGGGEGKPSLGVMVDLADPLLLLDRVSVQPF